MGSDAGRERCVMGQEADAEAGRLVVEVLHLLAVGHDGCRAVGDEGHLSEEVGALEVPDDLLLRVVVAEVLRDTHEFHPAGHALEHVDHGLLEAALGVACVHAARFERAEPVGVLEVPLEDRQRLHQARTFDEGQRLLEKRMQVDPVRPDLAVSGEDPDRALAGVLQVVPVGHRVTDLDPRLYETQVDEAVGRGALCPEQAVPLVHQLQHGGLVVAQVERHAVLGLDPAGGVADVVGRVAVLGVHHTGVVVRAQETVQQPGAGTQDDVVSPAHRQPAVVTEVLLEVGDHQQVADASLLQLGRRAQVVPLAELVAVDVGGVEVRCVEGQVGLLRVPERRRLEGQLGVLGDGHSLGERQVRGHTMLLGRGLVAVSVTGCSPVWIRHCDEQYQPFR